MEALVLNVDSLPLSIREKLRSPKVSVQERDGGIMLIPIQENIAKEEEKKLRIEYLKKLKEAVALSMDEELIYVPRSKEMREPVIFAD